MLKIEEYVANLKESKALSNDGFRIDTQQSYSSNSKFQNPVYKMAPLEHFQSITENKYSNIFSSYIQSPKHDDRSYLKQTPKKRTFSFAESQILKQPNDEKCNISAEFGSKPSSTCCFGNTITMKMKQKTLPQTNESEVKNRPIPFTESLLVQNSSRPQSLLSSPSKKHIRVEKNYSINSSFDLKQKKEQATTTTRPTSNSQHITLNEFDEIFKECQNNFEKNKTRKTEEYVACNIF